LKIEGGHITKLMVALFIAHPNSLTLTLPRREGMNAFKEFRSCRSDATLRSVDE
jgi:hypothetical protein